MVTYVVLANFTDQGRRSLNLGGLGNVHTESLLAFSAVDMTTIVGKML
jgi:uncharacterized protein with GYD domain